MHTGFDEYTLKKDCVARTYRGVRRILHKRLYINILYYVILLCRRRIGYRKRGSVRYLIFFFLITSGCITRTRFYNIYKYKYKYIYHRYLRIGCDDNILCISVGGFFSAARRPTNTIDTVAEYIIICVSYYNLYGYKALGNNLYILYYYCYNNNIVLS